MPFLSAFRFIFPPPSIGRDEERRSDREVGKSGSTGRKKGVMKLFGNGR